jgi:hypothetical protein
VILGVAVPATLLARADEGGGLEQQQEWNRLGGHMVRLHFGDLLDAGAIFDIRPFEPMRTLCLPKTRLIKCEERG